MKKCLVSLMLMLIMLASMACSSGSTTDAASEEKTAASVAQEEGDGTSESAQSGGSTEKLRFAYSMMTQENPWVISTKKGFEEKCAELGIDVTTVDAQYKVDKQVNDVESLINDGYDGILIGPIDQNALAELVEQAKSQGIIVMSIAQPIDNANGMITLDEYEYGKAIANNAVKWINENLGGKGKVAIISQDNVEAVIARGNGVEETIKAGCPDVEIVARQAGDTPEKGMEIIESVLQQHPDLNVVIATNDSGGLGGYQAMKSAGAVGDDRAVFAGDAAAEALAAMQEEGSIYRATVDLFPYKGGQDAAIYMQKFVLEGAPAETEIVMLDMVPVWQSDLKDGTYIPQG